MGSFDPIDPAMNIVRLTQSVCRKLAITNAVRTSVRQQHTVALLQKEPGESSDSLAVVANPVEKNHRSMIGILRLHEPGTKCQSIGALDGDIL